MLPSPHIPRRTLAGLLATAMLAALSACGGGGGNEEPTTTPSDGVWIVSPTNADTYQTQQTQVQLSGGAFVPSGSVCPTTVAAGYSVTWRNTTNNASGPAQFRLGCLLQVNIVWDTFPIPLGLGPNTVEVTARDAQGRVATDVLLVTRLP